jgi:hypothetical protein
MIDPTVFQNQKTASTQSTTPPTTQTSNDPYSTDWLKQYQAVYAKPWGGQSGTEQAWYRTPGWAGGVVWNPYYGWQSKSAVKDLYSQGPLSSEQFQGLGLTRNPGEDWKQYYQQLTGMTPEEGLAKQAARPEYNQGTGTGTTATGTGGTDMGNYDWNSWATQNQGTVPSYGQGAFDFSQIPMPQQWGQAGDFYSNMLQTGQPTSASDWYTQAKEQAGYDVQDAIKQAAEQAGMGGMRYSTPLGRTAQDISARSAANLGTQFAQQQMTAEEAARARQMSAAGGLQGMGQYQTGYAQDLANQAAGLGSQIYGQDQNTINQIISQFMRMSPENNPYLQNALGMSSVSGQPSTYQQSGLSQWMSGIGSLLPFLFML